MQTQLRKAYTLYLHVYADGGLFLLPGDSFCGYIGDRQAFSGELARLIEQDGILLYSFEDLHPEKEHVLGEISEIILCCDVEVELVDPHPQVYGFNDSFAPYLEEAWRRARVDVKGLERYLRQTELALTAALRGSSRRSELTKLQRRLKPKLRSAKSALKKIELLRFDLCVKAEGLEH